MLPVKDFASAVSGDVMNQALQKKKNIYLRYKVVERTPVAIMIRDLASLEL